MPQTPTSHPLPKLMTETLFREIDHKRRFEIGSFREVGRLTGVDPSLFTRLARGESISCQNLRAICRWLEMPMDWFFDDYGDDMSEEQSFQHMFAMMEPSTKRMEAFGNQIIASMGPFQES